MEWLEQAACQGEDVNLFYPEKGNAVLSNGAKAICARCPVRLPCLSYAMARRERYGVWGGMTVSERRWLERLAKRAS